MPRFSVRCFFSIQNPGVWKPTEKETGSYMNCSNDNAFNCSTLQHKIVILLCKSKKYPENLLDFATSFTKMLGVLDKHSEVWASNADHESNRFQPANQSMESTYLNLNSTDLNLNRNVDLIWGLCCLFFRSKSNMIRRLDASVRVWLCSWKLWTETSESQVSVRWRCGISRHV